MMASCKALCVALVILQTLSLIRAASPEPAAAPELTAVAVVAAKTPAQAPVDVAALSANLTEKLAEIGIPSADLVGKILPGANIVQVNAQLNSIIGTKIIAEAQQKAQKAAADTQQVLAAIANLVPSSALSPAAEAQLEVAELLSTYPTLQQQQAAKNTTTAGRKLKM
jgi:hypothetical protein